MTDYKINDSSTLTVTAVKTSMDMFTSYETIRFFRERARILY